MATVSKRSWKDGKGRQQEAWRVSYNDQSGKRRHKQFARKKDADAYALTAQWEVKQGIHTADADSVTVKEAGKIWLGAAEANGCDRGTVKSYKEVLELHIVPNLGAEKLSRLTAPRVVQFRDALLGSGRSHAMTSKAVRHLSMILIEAQTRGLVAQNVARGVKVKRPRNEKKGIAERAEIPPIEHLKALVAAADRLENEDPRLPVLIRVVMLAGLRQSEVRGLAWPAAALKKDAATTLTVTQRADRWNLIGAPKSEAGTRTIPIGPDLAARLRLWKVRCPPNDLNLMFPNARGGVIDQKGVTALFLKLQVAAGIAIDSGKRDGKGETIWLPRYGLHDLRHAFASAAVNDGLSLPIIGALLGHRETRTTQRYAHLADDPQKLAAAQIAGRIAKAMQKAQ
jgi:integrase